MNEPAPMTPAAGRFEKPATARQLLPPEAYTSQAWFDREQAELFGRAWSFAGMTADTPSAGDYRCVQVGRYPLFVLCGRDGALRAFHNICRHRGNQLLEGNGGSGAVLTCPYHHWSYDFEGQLAGVPQHETLFADLDMSEICLFPAALGTFRGMVFVNPQAEPEECFDDWLAEIPDHAWPHDVDKLVVARPTRYEIACNWKVFAENAMDGYHLMHLHDQTLKGPAPDNQDWEAGSDTTGSGSARASPNRAGKAASRRSTESTLGHLGQASGCCSPTRACRAPQSTGQPSESFRSRPRRSGSTYALGLCRPRMTTPRRTRRCSRRRVTRPTRRPTWSSRRSARSTSTRWTPAIS